MFNALKECFLRKFFLSNISFLSIFWLDGIIGIGEHNRTLNFRVDHRLNFSFAKLVFQELKGGLAFTLRFYNRRDVKFLCVKHACLLEDSCDASFFTAEGARLENFEHA